MVLHHSQTYVCFVVSYVSLNTIYLYIILKRKIQPASQTERLNTIYLYIILKPTTVYTYFFCV